MFYQKKECTNTASRYFFSLAFYLYQVFHFLDYTVVTYYVSFTLYFFPIVLNIDYFFTIFNLNRIFPLFLLPDFLHLLFHPFSTNFFLSSEKHMLQKDNNYFLIYSFINLLSHRWIPSITILNFGICVYSTFWHNFFSFDVLYYSFLNLYSFDNSDV